jgi:AraC-like DNA-binding protein
MSQAVELATAPEPAIRAYRYTTAVPTSCITDEHACGRTEQGRSENWARGKTWRSGPGSVLLKQPGDLHRTVSLDGPTTATVVVLPANDVALAREHRHGRILSVGQLEADDQRAAPFHRLHDAVCAGADRLTLEIALAEAVSAFVGLRSAPDDHSRAVRRAVEHLRERVAEPVTLDELAAYGQLDKFHLCRAFRAQVGLPPHAYLTHLRVQRARELLGQGVRASEVAPRVGLYDQSQLNRHFRKIFGVTAARYRGWRTTLLPAS